MGGRGNVSNTFKSVCDQVISIYDHHFFHMVGMWDETRPDDRLQMAEEKATILATVEGFGKYTHDKQRGLLLCCAAKTLWEPDEVWENPNLKTARWVYFKEFDHKPYTHSIFLVGDRKNQKGNEIVPFTCVPKNRSRGNKDRSGIKIYPVDAPKPPLRAALDTRGDFTR